MTTLILPSQFTPDVKYLEPAAWKRSWGVHRSFRSKVPDSVENPCVHGSMQFCDSIARRLNLSLLEPPDSWLTTLSERYLKREVRLLPLVEARQVKEAKFFKPANDKVFHAGVYARGEDVPHKHLDPQTPVLVSDIVSFNLEYRCYVLDNKVHTLSCYEWPGMLYQESPSQTAEAQAFASGVLKSSDNLPSAVVVDVGRLDSGAWAVVEANQAYASGIYHEADMDKVLDVIARSSSQTTLESDIVYIRQV